MAEQKVANKQIRRTAAKADITTVKGLASFRRALRQFLAFSETVSKKEGLTTMQYQALLAVKASDEEATTMKELAEELMMAQHGAVQLVDRMSALNVLRRQPDPVDARRVKLTLTPKGERLLARLAVAHAAELMHHNELLIESLRRLKAIRPSNSE